MKVEFIYHRRKNTTNNQIWYPDHIKLKPGYYRITIKHLELTDLKE